MITNNTIKYIQSLGKKKFRDEYKTFAVEGIKCNRELIESIPSQYLLVTETTKKDFEHLDLSRCEELMVVDEKIFSKITNQKTPQNVLAVYHQPQNAPINIDQNELILALDDVQDPGNLGTIIRLADWFGIQKIVCSSNTVDVFNPKTVQASMGAITRVSCYYLDLTDFLKKNQDKPIYGTFLDGTNIYTETLSQSGILVMGNEGNGISKNIEGLVSQKLYIPPYPANNTNTESLNVSIATAIICAEFRRRA